MALAYPLPQYGGSMFGARKSGRSLEHPAVGAIEDLLRAAASRHPVGDWERGARHVLHICACVTLDDAPDWIIFDTGDGVGWRRWPDDLPEAEVVRAPLEAGGHADPAQVLAWLRGDAADPWGGGGEGFGEPEVLIELHRQIAGS